MTTSTAQAVNQAMTEEVEAGKRTMRIMDPDKGDNKLVWDPNSETEVAVAKAAFDAAKKKGMAAYRVDKKGGKSTVITEFDEDAASMILAPVVVGG